MTDTSMIERVARAIVAELGRQDGHSMIISGNALRKTKEASNG